MLNTESLSVAGHRGAPPDRLRDVGLGDGVHVGCLVHRGGRGCGCRIDEPALPKGCSGHAEFTLIE